jgi:hypothetical protein
MSYDDSLKGDSMSLWVLVFALAVAMVASAQSDGPARSGAVGLVSPVPGAPLSVDQIEERTYKRPDGTSAADILNSKIYRDSAGRIRLESMSSSLSGESLPVVSLLDPVAGFAVLLLPGKIAARLTAPKSGTGGFFFPGVGEALPPGNWKTRTENLGSRMIEDIEFEGTRVTKTSEEHPPVIAIYEDWRSKELGMTGLAIASGPSGTHIAKVRNIDRHEPDSTLFSIPGDYTVHDLRRAGPVQQ